MKIICIHQQVLPRLPTVTHFQRIFTVHFIKSQIVISQKVLLPYQNLLNTDSLGHNVIEKALTFCSNEFLIYKF
jgi:hypothetical protein